MAEYIEREALWRAFEYEPFYNNADRDEIVLPKIDYFPSADVAPVRHGRLEVYLGGKELMCSCCKTTFWDEEQVGGSNYCPNCGAIMEKEKP